MPARSVVIEKLSKFTGERHEFLTPGEYTQLTGRAGRRGIDARGYAIVLWSPFVPFDQVASLASRRTDALTSAFHPTYNMAANLVRRYSKFEAHHLLNLSFAQFHADRDVVALERQLERTRTNLDAPTRTGAGRPRRRGRVRRAPRRARRGALESQRRLASNRRRARGVAPRRRGDGAGERRPGRRARPRPTAQAVAAHRRHRHPSRRHPPRPRRLRRVATTGRHRRTAPAGERPQPRLPQARRRTTPCARSCATRRIARSRTIVASQALEQRLAEHPAASRSRAEVTPAGRRDGRPTRTRSAAPRATDPRAQRQPGPPLRPGAARARVAGATSTVGRSPTRGSGSPACTPRPTSCSPRRSAKACSTGCARRSSRRLVSCFTFERRGPESDSPMPPPRWPTKTVAVRSRAIDKIARDLQADEDDAGLPETRTPDPGFTPYAYEWASGESLADVLDDDEMTGGDFVRHIKQCIDLLRQVGDVAPNEITRARAREAADACHRGVIAASGVAAGASPLARPTRRRSNQWRPSRRSRRDRGRREGRTVESARRRTRPTSSWPATTPRWRVRSPARTRQRRTRCASRGNPRRRPTSHARSVSRRRRVERRASGASVRPAARRRARRVRGAATRSSR